MPPILLEKFGNSFECVTAMVDVRSINAKYEKLMAELNLHDRLYYVERRPKISDFEYDCLKAESERLFEILSADGNGIISAGIGDDRESGFLQFEHLSPMLSLANTYSKEDLFRFGDRVGALLPRRKFSYVVEPKIDGIAVNLIYRDGKFFRALTRGNGTVGDDVGANVRMIKNFPLQIKNHAQIIEIRGEVYMDEKTFTEINMAREESGMEPFANPRNLAAGTLKTLDEGEVFERNLQLITYAIGHCSENVAALQSEVLEYLKELGFRSQEKYWVAQTIDHAWQCVVELGEARRNFNYWTDGAVLKVNELEFHGVLGATAKSPRWAIAYKFAPERAVTRIRDIVLQVGRTGVITPVAYLDEVQLSGTNVSRATLHNADDIAKKDIRIGDYVVVEKAGEIIPAVVSVEINRRGATSCPFVFPGVCPACGSRLIRLEGEVAWRCQNSRCLPQIRRRLEHFVSRSAMDINGLGILIIEKLIAAGKLLGISDVYRLTFDDLVALEKIGTRSALKILANIDRSKSQPLWRLLHGLGISGVGEQMAKILANNFHSIDGLIAADPAQLESLNGVGTKLSAAISAFFAEPNNAQVIDAMKTLGVSYADEFHGSMDGKNLKFHGKIFALTGTLGSMTRDEAIKKIEKVGGNVTNFVSKQTNVLVMGENGGSKSKKAKELGIEIWDEAAFLENVNADSPYLENF
ncbi:MAG: NAD-dependent DNA ligase LigA [Puniceicoccales bacterium]|nr:NAD-dependent DNA ligase LigA [Puniceicoccales bacterium]